MQHHLHPFELIEEMMDITFRLPLALIIFAAVNFGAGPKAATVISGTALHGLRPANSTVWGPTSVITKEEELELVSPPEGRRYGRLLILFSAPGHRYWWSLVPHANERSSRSLSDDLGVYRAAFVATGRFVVFGAPYGGLSVSESGGVADDVDEAESKTLDAINANVTSALNGSTLMFKSIKLPLPRSFYFDSPMSSMFRETKILKVVHDGDRWRLTLQCQWKEEIVLDANYDVVETERVD